MNCTFAFGILEFWFRIFPKHKGLRFQALRSTQTLSFLCSVHKKDLS